MEDEARRRKAKVEERGSGRTELLGVPRHRYYIL
jgi:hypothetical protein